MTAIIYSGPDSFGRFKFKLLWRNDCDGKERAQWFYAQLKYYTDRVSCIVDERSM
jgi:hypothetical protein